LLRTVSRRHRSGYVSWLLAREGAGLARNVDLAILTPNFAQLAANPNWFLHLRPGSQLIRAMAWEPLLERR